MHGSSQWVTVLPFFLMTISQRQSCGYPVFYVEIFSRLQKNSNMLDGSVNLITLENWLDKKLKSLLIPLADIISNEEDKQKERKFSHKNQLTNNMNVLVDKGNNKLTTYSNNSDKSAEIKSDHTSINSTLHKLSDTNPKNSKNNHGGTTNLDKSKRIDGCSKKHHTLPHDESRVNINVSSNISNTKVAYLQVLPIYVLNGTRSIKVNALLDSGSDSTLVTKTLADKLKLTEKDQPLTLSNAVCTSTRTMSKLVNFQILSPSHPLKILISNAWVVENLDLLRFTINSNTINKQWNHLQDIQIEVDNSQEISVLIGADYPHLHISKDVGIGNDDEPIAISTPLGWVLLGGKSRTNYVRTNFMVKETELLSNTVERFWSLESYGTCQKDDVSVLPLQ